MRGLSLVKRAIVVPSVALALLGSCTTIPVAPTPGEQVDVIIRSGDSYFVGTATYPQDLTEPVPAVLLLPGFLGERDELPVAGTASVQEGGRPLGIWEMTAIALADAGFASLRIDYRNSGRSPGRWQDATVTDQLDDARRALRWLADNPAVDGTRLALTGLSQGGAVAALISSDPLVDTVVLWSAAADFAWLTEFVPQELRPRIESDGIVTFNVPWGEQVTMGRAYFDSVASLDPLAGIAQFEGPLLSVAGSNDVVVAPQPAVAQSFLDAHSGPQSLVVLEADHTFDSFVGPASMEAAIEATLAWLEQHL